MKIVGFHNGLGNQMFQFAFYLSLKHKYSNEIFKVDKSWFDVNKVHNGFELDKIFKLDLDYSTSQENIILFGGYNVFARAKRKYLFIKKTELIESIDQQFHFFPDLYGKEGEDYYYLGFWQSYRYFELVSESVKNCFIFPDLTESKNMHIHSLIKSVRGRTVAVHVRRGDYLNNKSLIEACSLDYYKKAIAKIERVVKDPIYIIFSNDMNWCKSNFEFTNVEYVDWNEGKLAFRDMQLMSLCDNNIIANSTFSWWGAYLNRNKNKTVLAPRYWINGKAKDLIPDDWIRL